MISSHGLTEATVAQMAGVLARFRAVDRATLFGSRAKGTHKRGSDIDLALEGDALDWRTVGRIYDALDDLLLPHRFSLVIFESSTDPDVAAHISRVGVTLFERKHTGRALLRT